jgi:hypothetical protein
MPPKTRQLKQNLVKQEGRIQLAIQAVQNNQIQSIYRAVKVYNVLESTLRGRIKGNSF